MHHALRTSLVIIGLAAAAVVVAGPLSPPAGPVAPTHKTLTDVEPRIAISAAKTPGDADSVFRITQPGSYYLLANLGPPPAGFKGIEIAADDVTIDLRGFHMVGDRFAADAIAVDGSHHNITIRNGTISEWNGDGIDLQGPLAFGAIIEEVISHDHAGDGFKLPERSTLRHCVAHRNAGAGFRLLQGSALDACVATNNSVVGFDSAEACAFAQCTARANGTAGFEVAGGSTLSHCVANDNGLFGIRSSDTGVDDGGTTVSDSSASGNGHNGIQVSLGSSIINCSTRRNSGYGMVVSFGGTISGCSSAFDSGGGLYADTGSTITNSSAFNSSAIGITALNSCTVTNCTSRANSLDGFRVNNGCLVRGNTAAGNGPTISGGSGILLNGSDNRVEANNCIGNADFGIEATFSGSLIVANSLSGNTLGNFNLVAGNRVGPIVVAPASGVVTGNAGAAGLGTSDPWANIVY